ncbi:MAG TPA: AraC family transcriptional regulator, partial [Reyranellaceae bacterium]|nr:AraC family transcriptional regulator [Reyranellaceae bacterium]
MTDQVIFDEPAAGVQRLTARFAGHAYDPHRHETYSIGLTTAGLQCFGYRGAERASRPGQVIVLHPDELHDGHAGAAGGFAYRMVYIDPALIGATPFVPDVVADDATMRDIVDEAFIDFPHRLEPLAIDSLVGRMAGALHDRSDSRRPRRQRLDGRGVRLAREFLIAESHRTVASEELELVSGLDRFALARQFRAAYGTSPHRFQIGRRLARARRLIGQGLPLAEVATATGFADQSHFTRHFAHRFGLTPGRWATLAVAA